MPGAPCRRPGYHARQACQQTDMLRLRAAAPPDIADGHRCARYLITPLFQNIIARAEANDAVDMSRH